MQVDSDVLELYKPGEPAWRPRAITHIPFEIKGITVHLFVIKREQTTLANDTRLNRFEQVILPHLDSAYNLARWLTGHDQDAQDVVQEACLRAFRAFDNFYGDNGRAWLLTIVRNTAYNSLQKNKSLRVMTPFDEELHGGARASEVVTPLSLLRGAEDERNLRAAVEALPAEFREALILRHQDGLSYRKIACIAGVPIGTVMSRLARARARLKEFLAKEVRQDASS